MKLIFVFAVFSAAVPLLLSALFLVDCFRMKLEPKLALRASGIFICLICRRILPRLRSAAYITARHPIRAVLYIGSKTACMAAALAEFFLHPAMIRLFTGLILPFLVPFGLLGMLHVFLPLRILAGTVCALCMGANTFDEPLLKLYTLAWSRICFVHQYLRLRTAWAQESLTDKPAARMTDPHVYMQCKRQDPFYIDHAPCYNGPEILPLNLASFKLDLFGTEPLKH